MALIIDAYKRDEFLDIDQLISALGSSATKQAAQCSLRILERKGVILRSYGVRRFKRRMILEPTSSGLVEFGILRA
jgi:hypothetical protein